MVWKIMVLSEAQFDATENDGYSQYEITYFIYQAVSTTPTTFEYLRMMQLRKYGILRDILFIWQGTLMTLRNICMKKKVKWQSMAEDTKPSDPYRFFLITQLKMSGSTMTLTAWANAALFNVDITLSVLVLFSSQLITVTSVNQIIRLKACKDMDTKIDSDFKTSNCVRRYLIKVRNPKLIHTRQNETIQTMAILLQLFFFSQLSQLMSEGSGARVMRMLLPLKMYDYSLWNS